MTEPEPTKHRAKRKVLPSKGGGKGGVIALVIGVAVLVVGIGVALAMFVFKKDPKLPDQQALVSDENKSSESEDNGSLVPENTPGALTNSVANTEIDSSNNPDLPFGKRQEWTYGTGKMDILKVYKGRPTNILSQAFGEPDSAQSNGNIVVFSYEQMKVLKDGKQYSKVHFIIQKEAIGDAKVENVTVDPRSVVAKAPAVAARPPVVAARPTANGVIGKAPPANLPKIINYDRFKTTFIRRNKTELLAWARPSTVNRQDDHDTYMYLGLGSFEDKGFKILDPITGKEVTLIHVTVAKPSGLITEIK